MVRPILRNRPTSPAHITDMRQERFFKRSVFAKIRRTTRLLRLAIWACDTATIPLLFCRRCRLLRDDYAKLVQRTWAISTTAFNLNSYSDLRCLQDFRFRLNEVPRIADAVGWAGGKTTRSGYKCSPLTATCILLRRLAYPCRWVDLEIVFGMHSPTLSEVFWEAIESLYQRRSHLLTTFRSQLLANKAVEYASVIAARGAPLENCVGFIDCTKVQMCRPGGTSTNKRSVYSCHKRFHCLLYQTITTPDGLVFHLYRPVEGRRHDMTLYRRSTMEELLQNSLWTGGKQYCIYGDAAYSLRPWLQVGFPNTFANDQEKLHNTGMSAVREAVEWNYKEIKLYFTSQDMKRKIKCLEAPIALIYICANLLVNFKSCLGRKGQIECWFDCTPPSLEEYLSMNLPDTDMEQ